MVPRSNKIIRTLCAFPQMSRTLRLLQDGLVILLCGIIYRTYRDRRKRLLPLPPGLPKWPILGNALSIPLTYAHIFYKDLGEKLGAKFIYLEALGRPLLIINDYYVAQDLLEKRSALYSSRPQLPMLTNVVGVTWLFSILPYGDTWRNHRRIFKQHFSVKDLARDQETTLEFVQKALLPNLFKNSQRFYEHIRSCIGGLTMALAYGLPVKTRDDESVQFAVEAFEAMAGAAAPGKYLVNIFAPLRHVPDWMPGAGFKDDARILQEQLLKLREEPYQAALKAMNDGTGKASFVSESLERHRDKPNFDVQAFHIKSAAMQIFAAGTDTTASATLTFVLAMLKYPDVQYRAQAEIDSIVGADRLPDFSDLHYLPYLSAVIKEVLRWNPVTPLGVPHTTSDEDVYKGYYIPKDCIVMSNIYAMLHDEKIFKNPEEFDPERFFGNDDNVPDPELASFGFGRRECPGSHIAKSVLQIIAASILCLFDISPVLDSEGKPIDIIPEFTAASITSHPAPFQCKISPRKGKDVEALLRGYLEIDDI